jgi:hypothetical protein
MTINKLKFIEAEGRSKTITEEERIQNNCLARCTRQLIFIISAHSNEFIDRHWT